MGPPSGEPGRPDRRTISCIDDGCQRPVWLEEKLTGSFLDLRLIAARGNCLVFGWLCVIPGCVGGWECSKTKTCLGKSLPWRQGFTCSTSPFLSTEEERSIITSRLSSLQLQGNKQVVCEFDPHNRGGKKNLNFSASWWCIAVQMNRKVGRKVGRETATLFLCIYHGTCVLN